MLVGMKQVSAMNRLIFEACPEYRRKEINRKQCSLRNSYTFSSRAVQLNDYCYSYIPLTLGLIEQNRGY